MAAVLLVLVALSSVLATAIPPRPSGPVGDFARVLDSRTAQQITLVAQALWEQAKFGLVVATFPTLGDESIDDFAVRLYKTWGIGAKGTDEGVLVVLSTDPRKVKIEVGYGSEGYLNDAKAGRILDTYGVPLFRQNNFSQGLANVCGAIAQTVEQEKNISLHAPQRQRGSQQAYETKISPLKALFIFIVLIILVSTPFGRSLLFFMLLSGMMGGGRRGGGGFGGGFGGGGFGGGFGGGMSGGGGASRGF